MESIADSDRLPIHTSTKTWRPLKQLPSHSSKNPEVRADRLGNLVHDEAILECSKYRHNPDIFSVMPKGDKLKPKKQ
jgi:hypothetical protein